MAKPQSPPRTFTRVERILAYVIAAVAALSLACMVATLIATAVGMPRVEFLQGVWPAVINIPSVGFPICIVLIIVLLITNIVRRRRENAETSRRG